MKTTPNDVTLKEQALRELALDEFQKRVKGREPPPFTYETYVVDVVYRATQRVCYEMGIDYYGTTTSHHIVYATQEVEIPDTEHIDEFINGFYVSEINLTNFGVLIEGFGKYYYS